MVLVATVPWMNAEAIARRLLLAALGSASVGVHAASTVVLDGTLKAGTSGTALAAAGTVTRSGVTYNRIAIPENVGKRAGGNLFHSFGDFSIGKGDGAVFTLGGATSNVIARVTGGQASAINGLLSVDPGSTGSKPAFFLVNPAGIAFGAGAAIDVPGALHATTAHYLKFPDGELRTDTATPSTFSSAAPEAFGFLGSRRATVSVAGATLRAGVGAPVSVVAGDVEVAGGIVYGGSGNVRVAAIGAAATDVPLSGPATKAAGHLSITNGGYVFANTRSAANGGRIDVEAGSIAIDGQNGSASTGIFSQAQEGATGYSGDIAVSAAGELSLVAGGQIASGTWSSGNAGKVQVRAGTLKIDGQDSKGTTGISSQAGKGSGHAGDIDIAASGSISIVSGGLVNSDTWSGGHGGSIAVQGASLVIDGKGTSGFTGITGQSNQGATGDGGDVGVSIAGHLAIAGGGHLSSDTYSSGRAGKVTVTAGSAAIDGHGLGLGISSNAGTGSTAAAGEVDVSVAGNMSIVNGGGISSSTAGTGDGGNVLVKTGNLTIDAKGYYASSTATRTRIASDSFNAGGKGGNVEVVVQDALTLYQGGMISSSSWSSGNAGSVKVHAGRILIDSQGHFDADIYSSSQNGTANAGSVEVTAVKEIAVVHGGDIESNTYYSSGKGGTVKVTADSITLDMGNISSLAGVKTTGDAGDIQVAANSISMKNGGNILSNSYYQGNAGSVKVNAVDIAIEGSATQMAGIYTDVRGVSGNAGAIEVKAAGTLSLVNGAAVASEAHFAGQAGSVKISVGNLVADGRNNTARSTGISSNAYGKANLAGNIEVLAAGTVSLVDGAKISSDAAATILNKAGSVKVAAPEIRLAKSQISSSVSGMGIGGTVTVDAGKLVLVDQASIKAAVNPDKWGLPGSVGVPGSVDIRASEQILLSGGSEFSIVNTAVAGLKIASAPRAALTVKAPDIALTDAGISASATGRADASDIVIEFFRRLALTGGSIVTTANIGNGGAIRINGGDSLMLERSQITTSVAGSSGNGGDIRVRAKGLVMDTGFIQANTAAAKATGGDIHIDARTLVPSGNTLFVGGAKAYGMKGGVFGFNVIQAAAPTGLSGTIDITAPALDISGTLTGLSARMFDAGGLGRNPCEIAGGSSLVQAGRGGFAPSSRGLLGTASPEAAYRSQHFSSTDFFPPRIQRTCANT